MDARIASPQPWRLMMRRILLAAGFAAAAALAGPAFAGVRDVLAANTLILIDGADHQTAYLFDADGSFTQTTYDGQHAHGAWTLKDGRLCVTPQGQSTACVPMGDDRIVGYAWEIKGPTGQVVWHAEIIAGREKIDGKAG
jgi:YD repeat-containing protein